MLCAENPEGAALQPCYLSGGFECLPLVQVSGWGWVEQLGHAASYKVIHANKSDWVVSSVGGVWLRSWAINSKRRFNCAGVNSRLGCCSDSASSLYACLSSADVFVMVLSFEL